MDRVERNIFLKEQLSEKGNQVIDDIENEAKRTSNHLWIAYASQMRMSLNQFSRAGSDSLHVNCAFIGMKELDLFIEKHGADPDKIKEADLEIYQNLRVSFLYLIVNAYLFENKYELASFYIERMLNEGKYGKFNIFESTAYYLLGLSYLHAKKGNEALVNFRKGYKIYKQPSVKKQPYEYFRFFNGISNAYLILKDYDQIIQINDSLQMLVEAEHQKIKVEGPYYHMVNFVICYETALALIKKGEYREARQKLDQAEEISSKHMKDSQHVCVYYQTEAEYYAAIKDFDTSKRYTELSDNCLSALHEGQSNFNYISDNLSKADILDQSGESKEAYTILRGLFDKVDSLSSVNFSKQLAEIQTLYKVDKMKIEGQRDKTKLRIAQLIVFILIFISISLGYIVYITRKNSKALYEKNKQLYSQHSVLEKNKLTIKELESLHSEQKDTESVEITPHACIMNNLEEYLTTTKAYKNSNISREDLALAVGTNRQYLIEAIKAETGQTFNEYIYSHRIKYAYHLIETNEMNKISDISNESGFVTLGTFNRAFKETYGMNPSELKKLLKNKS